MNRRRKTTRLIENASASIKNVIYATFPQTSPQEREDIEQGVKLKIWRKIASGTNIDNFRSYLWKVVYTTALDMIKERMENKTDAELQSLLDTAHFERLGAATPEIHWQNEELKMSVREAVETLPDRRKTVLRLWLCDMSLDEIAERLGWRSNQVRHLLYRGIDDLKKTLNPDRARREDMDASAERISTEDFK
jgi:RNA polymerase sigma-70 factor (ECF subfamily)